MVTDYGVAVNPREPNLLKASKAANCIPLKMIQEPRGTVYFIVGEPEKVQFADCVVGIIGVRDDIIMDAVRQPKPFEFVE